MRSTCTPPIVFPRTFSARFLSSTAASSQRCALLLCVPYQCLVCVHHVSVFFRRKRSGNPGYLSGAPVLAGTLSTNTTTSKTAIAEDEVQYVSFRVYNMNCCRAFSPMMRLPCERALCAVWFVDSCTHRQWCLLGYDAQKLVLLLATCLWEGGVLPFVVCACWNLPQHPNPHGHTASTRLPL